MSSLVRSSFSPPCDSWQLLTCEVNNRWKAYLSVPCCDARFTGVWKVGQICILAEFYIILFLEVGRFF